MAAVPQNVEGPVALEREISIVQSIQLGFSRSQGSTTLNDANKSVMLRAEWTITSRQAVLRLAQMKYRYFVLERCQMKYRYFVLERCQQNTIFSGTSHQKRTYLDNKQVIYCLFPARALLLLSD